MSNKQPFTFIEGISSSYEEWFEKIRDQLSAIETVVEVGTFNGGGTKFLERSFPKALIYTFERPDHYEPEHIDLPQIYSGLSKRVTPLAEISPPVEFHKEVDLCVFDIGHDKENLERNISFWKNQLSKNGFLLMLLPWSNQKKRDVKRDSIPLVHYSQRVKISIPHPIVIFPAFLSSSRRSLLRGENAFAFLFSAQNL